MQKLKLQVIEQMIKMDCTNAEISFMLHIARYQDEDGSVVGVYYKDTMEELGISYQKFYDLKQSLIEKELISAEKNSYTDWDITILNNDFTDGDFSCGYVSVNKKIFFTEEFKKFKANEKLLAIHLLIVTGAGNRSFRIRKSELFKKYCEMLGVSKRFLRFYLENLKSLFSIGIEQGLYYITPLKANLDVQEKGEVIAYNRFRLNALLRRFRIKFTDESFNDIFQLLKQYSKYITIMNLKTAIMESLIRINDGILNKYKWNRELQPKYVHILLREKLGL